MRLPPAGPGGRAHRPVADLLSEPRTLADLLGVVELTEVRNTQLRKLSGGQRRRLDLALALAGDPDLVFLDEPTTGFDPEARRRCWAAIENLRRLGKTILLTTHYLDEAEQLANLGLWTAAGAVFAIWRFRWHAT